MIYFGYFLFAFIAIRFLVALTNLCTEVYIPHTALLSDYPKISILIPARNEAKNIGPLLSDLSVLTYPNYEVIVYNDCSTDNTAEIVNEFIDGDKRFKLIDGQALEDGWLGKNWGCHNLALQASGDYLLFLDADVRLKADLLEKAYGYVAKYKLKLLSIFPQQIIVNKETQEVIPLMNWILLSLLPLILVRLSSWTSFSAANGQFMLFETNTYKKHLPHKVHKHHKVEDIAICRYYKKNKLRTATILGDESMRCRMYTSKKEAIDGFSKNVFDFFGGSVLSTLIFALITTVAPFFIYIAFNWYATVLYCLLIIGIRIFVSLSGKQSVTQNLIYIPLQQYSFLKIIYTALKHRKNKSLSWKGRNIVDSL